MVAARDISICFCSKTDIRRDHYVPNSIDRRTHTLGLKFASRYSTLQAIRLIHQYLKMPRGFGPTTHHCPLKSKGNCRGGRRMCTVHQTACPIHGIIHLKTESCRTCKGVCCRLPQLTTWPHELTIDRKLMPTPERQPLPKLQRLIRRNRNPRIGNHPIAGSPRTPNLKTLNTARGRHRRSR